MTDLVLAIFHHILVFGLVAMLATEAALVRPAMSPAEARRVANVDAGYGAAAALIIVVGLLRVIYGAKGADYYVHNPWFWAKIASFAAVGVLSLPPTVRFLAWRRALKADPDFVPGDWEVARIRLWLRLELGLVVLIVAFAAAMARYGG